jgi:Beta-lactamase
MCALSLLAWCGTVSARAGLSGASGGPRGTVTDGTGGYAALGALLGDVTGQPYPDAAAGLVLGPLGMASSWFPERWPDAGARAVTGYRLNEEGSFRPAPAHVGTVQAALGLWATAADLVRFGTGWFSLLPAALAREALRPQVWPRADTMVAFGLGWRVNEPLGVAGGGGTGRGVSASLVLRLASGHVHVAMTNRSIPVEPVNGRIIRAIGGHLPVERFTFLFTDIEGSTALLGRAGQGVYEQLLVDHHAIIRSGLAAHGGRGVDTQGDAFLRGVLLAGGARGGGRADAGGTAGPRVGGR